MEIYRCCGTVQYLGDIPGAFPRSTPPEAFEFAGRDGKWFFRGFKRCCELKRGFKNEVAKVRKLGQHAVRFPLKGFSWFRVIHETQDTQFALRAMDGQGDTGAETVTTCFLVYFFLLAGGKNIW